MATVSGCICVRKNDEECLIKVQEPTNSEKFTLKLKPELAYFVGIDQSSSCTGVFIMDVTNTVTIMIDFKRDTNNKEVFYRELKGFLAETFRNTKVQLIVHEEPIPNPGKAYSGEVLRELRGRLREWISDIPALSKAELHSLYPQSWKKFIVSKENAKNYGQTFKNRCNNKRLIAFDVCQLMPQFKQYWGLHYASDYDAFDAAGILLGYLRYAFDEKGRRRICGIKEKRHVSLVFYSYVDKVELNSNPYALTDQLGNCRYEIEPTLLYFNTEFNKYDNIRMASSNWNSVVTYLPDKYTEELQWLFGFDKDPNKIMVMYVFRKGSLTAGQIRELKIALPWNEEIQ